MRSRRTAADLLQSDPGGDIVIEEMSPSFLEVSGRYIQLPYSDVEGFDLQWHQPTARFYLMVCLRTQACWSNRGSHR